MTWHINSWKNFTAEQQPEFSNLEELKLVEEKLASNEPIAKLERIIELKNKLAAIDNNSIVLQAGDCAEPILENPLPYLNEFKNLYNECDTLLKTKFSNVIKLARIGGQFAKPRSAKFENKQGKEFQIYRGDLINDIDFSEDNRKPDPKRMLSGYKHSKIIYDNLNDIYSSHEALLLPYEANLIRKENEIYYSSSADFLWIGNRTRFIGSAHIELLKGIINPIGVKIDHNYTFEEIDNLILNLNPNNEKGKISFVCRMGINNIKTKLEPLLNYCIKNNYNINWMIDPMHGNTYVDNMGIKRRNVEDLIFEALYFIEKLNANKILIGGIHLEISYENVKECLEKNFLGDSVYLSRCDPRLNREQLLRLLNACLL